MSENRWYTLSLRDLFFLVTIAAIITCWQLDRRELIAKYNPTLIPTAHWQVDQVLGKPDTTGQGDLPTAWASATQDGAKEWLELKYNWMVRPSSIEVRETYNPGAITKVTMFDWQGREKVVWEGVANLISRQSPNQYIIPIKSSFLTRRIKLYIDSPAVVGWNEIDAVALVDAKGRKFWATGASASSCYDDRYKSFNSGLNQPRIVRGQVVSQPAEPELSPFAQ